MKKGSRILCYGDSNTYGYDPRGMLDFRYDEKHRWVDLLSDYGYVGINEGSNGREFPTERIGYGCLNAILKKHADADLLVIMLGTNDVVHVPLPSETEVVKKVQDMFLAVKSLSHFTTDGRKILLISPPPLTLEREEGISLVNVSKRLGAALEAFAKAQNICFADAATWDIEMAFDGTHFTENGHLRFAKALANTLDTL